MTILAMLKIILQLKIKIFNILKISRRKLHYYSGSHSPVRIFDQCEGNRFSVLHIFESKEHVDRISTYPYTVTHINAALIRSLNISTRKNWFFKVCVSISKELIYHWKYQSYQMYSINSHLIYFFVSNLDLPKTPMRTYDKNIRL